MTRESMRAGLISVATVSEALTKARGDLFVAASILHITARELDIYIRQSDKLQGHAAAIKTVQANEAYERMSADQFRAQIEQAARGYQLDALEQIHALAMMEITNAEGVPSAALAEVKLKAAVQLRGAQGPSQQDASQAAVLAEMNALYQASAPRIKSIRTLIEFKE